MLSFQKCVDLDLQRSHPIQRNHVKKLFILIALTAAFTQANAAKNCAELKSEIAVKLDAAGVKAYTLDIVANDKAGNAKVVGSCDSGSKKITYTKKN